MSATTLFEEFRQHLWYRSHTTLTLPAKEPTFFRPGRRQGMFHQNFRDKLISGTWIHCKWNGYLVRRQGRSLSWNVSTSIVGPFHFLLFTYFFNWDKYVLFVGNLHLFVRHIPDNDGDRGINLFVLVHFDTTRPQSYWYADPAFHTSFGDAVIRNAYNEFSEYAKLLTVYIRRRKLLLCCSWRTRARLRHAICNVMCRTVPSHFDK